MTIKTNAIIKSYTNRKGETLYMVKAYIGIDSNTGRPQYRTLRGYKTLKDAEFGAQKLLNQL